MRLLMVRYAVLGHCRQEADVQELESQVTVSESISALGVTWLTG